jgi:RimJ/RimL family protein N-acetyltransferase
MEENEPCPFIEGKEIDLIPNNPNNVSLYAKWINDPKVRKYSRNELPLTLEEVKKRWFKPREPGERRKEIAFEIWHKNEKETIGVVGLSNINWFTRWANAFIQIGEKRFWSQNIATEATMLLLKYAFDELDLHQLSAGIAVPNVGSWRVAEKAGFIFQGISKSRDYVDGEYVDLKFYSYFQEDWMNLRK